MVCYINNAAGCAGADKCSRTSITCTLGERRQQAKGSWTFHVLINDMPSRRSPLSRLASRMSHRALQRHV